jgi:CubicO group peptidase (beta-lactamase class C family)
LDQSIDAGALMTPRLAQSRVQQLIDTLVRQNKERGLQVAAYLDGELIVDVWTGMADPATKRLVDGETLFPVFSVTKGMASTAVHILVARGQLRYDDPLARYWPEFGAHGKEHITLRQALAHLSGVPHMPEGLVAGDLGDWAVMCRRLADLTPLWPPGAKTYYHAMTFGWIVGEAAHRADGRDFKTIIQEEVSRPLGIDSLFVGIPDQVEARVAILEADPHPPKTPVPGPAPAPDPVAERSIPAYVKPLEDFMNRPDARRACIPASSGIMNARAIARHYAALVGSGVGGVRLFDDDVRRRVTQRQPAIDGPTDAGFGLGYALYGPPENPGCVFGHGGYGGSQGMADTRYNLAVGIAKNRMTISAGSEGTTTDQILRAIREVLG